MEIHILFFAIFCFHYMFLVNLLHINVPITYYSFLPLGILSTISCGSLALFSILSIIQLAMITSRDEVVLKYKTCVILKLTLAIISGKLKKYCEQCAQVINTINIFSLNSFIGIIRSNFICNRNR